MCALPNQPAPTTAVLFFFLSLYPIFYKKNNTAQNKNFIKLVEGCNNIYQYTLL